VDVGNEKLFKNTLDAKNSKPSLEIEVSQKGTTFYFEKRNNVHSGTKQQNVQMFDHFKSTKYF
jgi:hypothetical protein